MVVVYYSERIQIKVSKTKGGVQGKSGTTFRLSSSRVVGKAALNSPSNGV